MYNLYYSYHLSTPSTCTCTCACTCTCTCTSFSPDLLTDRKQTFLNPIIYGTTFSVLTRILPSINIIKHNYILYWQHGNIWTSSQFIEDSQIVSFSYSDCLLIILHTQDRGKQNKIHPPDSNKTLFILNFLYFLLTRRFPLKEEDESVHVTVHIYIHTLLTQINSKSHQPTATTLTTESLVLYARTRPPITAPRKTIIHQFSLAEQEHNFAFICTLPENLLNLHNIHSFNSICDSS